MTHICVSKLTSIGSDNGLSPGRCQGIVRSNTVMIVPLGTNVSELSIEVHTLSFKKMHLNMTFEKWQLLCLILNVLNSVDFCNMGRKFRGIRPPVGTVMVFVFLISWASDDLEDYFHTNEITRDNPQYSLRALVYRGVTNWNVWLLCVCYLLETRRLSSAFTVMYILGKRYGAGSRNDNDEYTIC